MNYFQPAIAMIAIETSFLNFPFPVSIYDQPICELI